MGQPDGELVRPAIESIRDTVVTSLAPSTCAISSCSVRGSAND